MKSILKRSPNKTKKKISFNSNNEIKTIERVAELQRAFDELETARNKIEKVHQKTHQLINDMGLIMPEGKKIKSMVKEIDFVLKRSSRHGGRRRSSKKKYMKASTALGL